MEERLQKVLAAAGVASRREAEKYILGGRVKVNGKVVKELGTKVDEKCFITVDGKPIKRERKAYYLFYKPRGVVTTMSDPQGRRTVADYVLLLTNDGALAQGLMHPSREVNKTYRVGVPGIVPQEKLDLLRLGVKLDDGMTAPAVVTLLEYDHERNMTYFDITIHEGRNRQIRRMCDYIGFPVRNLKRIKFGTLSLKGLSKGKMRELNEDEAETLKKAAKLNG